MPTIRSRITTTQYKEASWKKLESINCPLSWSCSCCSSPSRLVPARVSLVGWPGKQCVDYTVSLPCQQTDCSYETEGVNPGVTIATDAAATAGSSWRHKFLRPTVRREIIV